MADFADVADLALLTGRDVDEARGEFVLDLAAAAIREWVGQTLSLVTDDEIQMRGNFSDQLWLPQRPVRSVDSITVDTTTIDNDLFRFTSDGLVTFYRSAPALDEPAFTNDRLGFWAGSDVVLTVVYSHGYDPIPDVIRGVCLDIAGTFLATPEGAAITQETIGAYSVSYARRAAGIMLTAEHRRSLRSFKRQNFTVPVGA